MKSGATPRWRLIGRLAILLLLPATHLGQASAAQSSEPLTWRVRGPSLPDRPLELKWLNSNSLAVLINGGELRVVDRTGAVTYRVHLPSNLSAIAENGLVASAGRMSGKVLRIDGTEVCEFKTSTPIKLAWSRAADYLAVLEAGGWVRVVTSGCDEVVRIELEGASDVAWVGENLMVSARGQALLLTPEGQEVWRSGVSLRGIEHSGSGLVCGVPPGSGSLVVVDASSGETLWSSGVSVDRYSWSPDGQHLAATGAGRVYVWRASSGEEVGRTNLISEELVDLAWAPDSLKLAAAGRESVTVYSRKGERLWTLRLPGISLISWSPDGTRLAVATPAYLYFVDAAPAPIWSSELPWPTRSLDIGGNGQVAVGGLDGISVLGPAGEVYWSLPLEKGEVLGLSWQPGGDALAVGTREHYELYLIEGGSIFRRIPVRVGGHGQRSALFKAVDWSPGGDRIAVGFDTYLAVVGSNGEVIWEFDLGKPIFDVDWSEGGGLIAVAAGEESPEVAIFSEGGELVREVPTGAKVSAVDWGPDGRLAVGTVTGEVILLDEDGRRVASTNLDRLIKDVSWSPDGSLVALACSGGLVVTVDASLETLWSAESLGLADAIRIGWSRDGSVLYVGGVQRLVAVGRPSVSASLRAPATIAEGAEATFTYSITSETPLRAVAKLLGPAGLIDAEDVWIRSPDREASGQFSLVVERDAVYRLVVESGSGYPLAESIWGLSVLEPVEVELSAPEAALVGETFNVTVSLLNPNSVELEARVEVEVDGSLAEARGVSLAPLERTPLEFALSAAARGAHEISVLVRPNGAPPSEASVSVIARAIGAEAAISGPTELVVGEAGSLTATVKNLQDESDFSVFILVNGEVVETHQIHLGPGETWGTNVPVDSRAPGRLVYVLRVEAEGATVSEATHEVAVLSWFQAHREEVAAAVGAAAAISVAIAVIVRKRRRETEEAAELLRSMLGGS